VLLLKTFLRGQRLDQVPQKTARLESREKSVRSCNLPGSGNILVFFSHREDLEQYRQIIERIGHLDKSRPDTTIRCSSHTISADTMEEKVMKRRNSKRTVQDIQLDAVKKKGRL
jgi:hypothetical protein